ncbi:amino acid permease [Ferrimonas sp. SCSIO 43195]|uniref:amino acid permease n=1 Tax=Ferrimonas sp. SCSIO 43195 TaxID=2822844 RepID=UPI0020758535|nr:aromatic amino acid transport family protein [Ferrimonas sp. SCSIO 43195]USD38137.1 amino acid permease [Ferrimonas sp. SCSIO 43195]
MNSKLLGATLIVAGTSIGAGMLALPIAVSHIGFWPAMALMVLIWGLSGYTALLLTEANLRVGCGLNFHGMAGKALGPWGQLICSASFLALLYALTAAYLTGGASLVTLKAQSLLSLPLDSTPATLIFACTLGLVAAFGVKYVDLLTRGLFSLKMVALLILVAMLLPQSEPANLALNLQATLGNSHYLIAALPLIFTSFGFHVCIPPLVKYLNGDVGQLRKAFLLGSALPLLCYSLWLLSVFGPMGVSQLQTLAEGDSLANLVTAMTQITGSGRVGTLVTLFADLALVTSFIGVTLSLFEYLAELRGRRNGKVSTWLITFVPPLTLALAMPEGFIAVLGFAAIPLAVLIVFLPVAMAIKLRQPGQGGYQVRGGKPALALVTVLGAVIVAAQLA